ncbi:MAG: hydroxyacylglutathione hydrolase [Peptoniphilus sp.]|nr:hydroxyacylglutathione hydrolase [Peptoniphilus sp.]MDY3119101.1 hydroxyacylglutathione hydrolase [Peptoniphilus sp.]
MKIMPLPALSDNYIWIIEKEKRIVVVDPSEADLLLRVIEQKGYTLEAVLLTHKHPDHIGGVNALQKAYPVPVYGPEETKRATDVVKGEESIDLLGETFEVIATPGHTEGHVAYAVGEHLFIGDTLFLSGCGRVFSGDYEAMFKTLQGLKTLDDGVKVYPAHEYSLSNLQQSVTYVKNDVAKKELERVRRLREEGLPTLPTTIGKEKQVNPFLIIDDFDEFMRYRKFRDQS